MLDTHTQLSDTLSRFPKFRRILGSSTSTLLPAPRISGEKRLDLGMVADGKLPLEAFNEHEVR